MSDQPKDEGQAGVRSGMALPVPEETRVGEASRFRYDPLTGTFRLGRAGRRWRPCYGVIAIVTKATP